MTRVTVGIDIGTTSTKAVAADDDGHIVARSRVPHAVRTPEPDLLEHDPDEAWRRGPIEALEQLGSLDVAGIGLGAMVPSLAAFDTRGDALTGGPLYGDRRGATDAMHLNPGMSGEARAQLRWAAEAAPEAAYYWPAQAAAAHALTGTATTDVAVVAALYPVFSGTGWDADLCAELGVSPEQLPGFAMTGTEVGTVPVGTAGVSAPLAAPTVDALGEQLVSGVADPGDALVICGTTLITWSVVDAWREVAGLWSIPYHLPGRFCLGGASNAGGLFLNWAKRLLADGGGVADPGRVPVWSPYPRGERTPLYDAEIRGALHGLDLTHTAASVRRAAYEAAGFVVRRNLDLADAGVRRIVATGGGVYDAEWVQALADCTGRPVDVVAVPEGAALGMAWLGRMAAGLETSLADAGRWARTSRRVDPDPAWTSHTEDRYQQFLETGP